MNRRNAIKLIGAIGLSTAAGSYYLARDRDHEGLTIQSALVRLHTLDLDLTEVKGEWGIARVLSHLAQSIEFSMDGFAEMKSKLFQASVGPLAYQVFQSRGRMAHSLSEPIPGEDISTAESDPAQAMQRLIRSLERFDAFPGALKPHFAYGELDKRQYEMAHVMHINNHFEEISIRTPGNTS